MIKQNLNQICMKLKKTNKNHKSKEQKKSLYNIEMLCKAIIF